MTTKKGPSKTAKRAKTTAKRPEGALAKSAPALLDVEKARELLEQARSVEEILEIRDAAKLAAEYARIRGASIGSVNDALELALRAQRKFGIFLVEEGPTHGGDRKSIKVQDGTLIKLADLGVSKKEASRCRKLAGVDEQAFEDHINAVRAKGERLTTSGTIAATSEAKDYDGDEWGTPPEYIALAREVLEEIDLDPASNEHAQTVVLAAQHYTKADDGLEKEWSGRIWLNPPYSHPAVERFTSKLIAAYEEGEVTAAICLVNNATDTEWCQALLTRCAAVCLPKGRIGFLDSTGKAANGTRQGQAFFYFGEDVETFEAVFGDVGAVLKP